MVDKRDDRTPYPIDYERYAAALKVTAKKRKERSSKMIDPEDPTTWPRKLETKRERLMYMFDILGGSNLHGSYKQVWVDDFFDGADSKRVKLSRDILEDVADLNAIEKVAALDTYLYQQKHLCFVSLQLGLQPNWKICSIPMQRLVL